MRDGMTGRCGSTDIPPSPAERVGKVACVLAQAVRNMQSGLQSEPVILGCA